MLPAPCLTETETIQTILMRWWSVSGLVHARHWDLWLYSWIVKCSFSRSESHSIPIILTGKPDLGSLFVWVQASCAVFFCFLGCKGIGGQTSSGLHLWSHGSQAHSCTPGSHLLIYGCVCKVGCGCASLPHHPILYGGNLAVLVVCCTLVQPFGNSRFFSPSQCHVWKT